MPHWSEAAVTKAGVAMLNEMMAGRRLTLTRAAGGAGRADGSSLGTQEALLDPRQALSLIGEQDGPDGKTVTVQISNRGVESAYRLQQVGVYAALEPEGQIEPEDQLLFIMQDAEGVQIPPEAEESFLLEIYCLLRIDSGGRLTVTVDPAGLVTVERLEETLNRYRPLSGGGDPTTGTTGTVGQHYVNTDTGREFVCVGVSGAGCIWQARVSGEELLEAVDRLTLGVMTNTLTLPLATSAGEPLLTSEGAPILAAYHPDQSASARTALEALAADLSGRLAAERVYTDAGLRTASLRDRAYTDGKIQALDRALSSKLEAQGADTANQIAAHSASAASHPTHLSIIQK